MDQFARLDGGGVTLALAIPDEGAPRLLYIGASLPAHADLAALAALHAPARREAAPDQPQHATILPVAGAGWLGPVALAGRTEGGDGLIALKRRTLHVGAHDVRIDLADDVIEIGVTLSWDIDAASGIVTTRASVRNESARAFHLDGLAALALPLPAWAREIMAFAAGWSREQRPTRFPAPRGQWAQIARGGRTGFAGATFLMLEPGAGDLHGRALGLHLGWSGDHRLAVETLSDGARIALLEEALAPGEVTLAPGEAFETPRGHIAFSESGFAGLTAHFQDFARAHILPPAHGPRRVHFNSWEGVYFDFDAARLMALAAEAATLGAERFVLDDGWFIGRRDDTSALGDWRVDPARFPNGLDEVIDHVEALGMDFGLWVEPDMVSPRSALHEAHPDWCVHAPGRARATMRNQLWLDLSRPEVRDHLFAALDALLSRHRIAYLKWDCNRDIFPAVSHGGPGSGAIVRGTYDVMARVRAAHPRVEIESCASGGARVDYGIMRCARRIWPSDSTDAEERLRIQRWAALLLPLGALGAHVGSSTNHTTGRRLDMAYRARVALFGHMGLELDPARLKPHEKEVLAAHVALYKQHRALLHDGRFIAWESADGSEGRIVIARDGGEALALLASGGAASPFAQSAPMPLPGLDEAARYDVRLIKPWPRVVAQRLADAALWEEARRFDGAALMRHGLALPLTQPHIAWLLHLVRV